MTKSELAPTEDQSILYVSGRGPETATIEYTRHYARKMLDVYETIEEYEESFFMLGFGGAPNPVFGGFKLDLPHTRDRSQHREYGTLRRGDHAFLGAVEVANQHDRNDGQPRKNCQVGNADGVPIHAWLPS